MAQIATNVRAIGIEYNAPDMILRTIGPGIAKVCSVIYVTTKILMVQVGYTD